MKKSCLLFMILCTHISFSIKSAEAQEEERKNFSLKNKGRDDSIYFMAISGGKLKSGLLRPGFLADEFFEADDLSNIAKPMRLYIWKEDLFNVINLLLLQKLKKEVFESQLLPINQIKFSYKPDLFFEFPSGKAIHLKWKNEILLPREGVKPIMRRRRMNRYTSEGYPLINNVTINDIRDVGWVFDKEEGRWLDKEDRLEKNPQVFIEKTVKI